MVNLNTNLNEQLDPRPPRFIRPANHLRLPLACTTRPSLELPRCQTPRTRAYARPTSLASSASAPALATNRSARRTAPPLNTICCALGPRCARALPLASWPLAPRAAAGALPRSPNLAAARPLARRQPRRAPQLPATQSSAFPHAHAPHALAQPAPVPTSGRAAPSCTPTRARLLRPDSSQLAPGSTSQF
nr:uncharacterized protein LOC127326091 [Lolium perenne]